MDINTYNTFFGGLNEMAAFPEILGGDKGAVMTVKLDLRPGDKIEVTYDDKGVSAVQLEGSGAGITVLGMEE
jgi:hypothetical protein